MKGLRPEHVVSWPDRERTEFFNGVSIFDSGFEIYRRPVGSHDVAAIARQGANLKNYARDCLYRLRPKPEPSDIAKIVIEPSEGYYKSLIMTIKRGHYAMLDFLKEHTLHGGMTTQLVGNILQVACNCGSIEVLDARSIK